MKTENSNPSILQECVGPSRQALSIRKQRMDNRKRKEYVRFEFDVHVTKVVLEEVPAFKRYFLCCVITGKNSSARTPTHTHRKQKEHLLDF